MSTLAVSTHDSTAALADKLRRYGAKVLGKMLGTSPRTPKNWLEQSNAPTWKHVVAMLNDAELCPLVLEAAGRQDLARYHEEITLNQRIERAKAATQAAREHADGIRKSMEMGSGLRAVDVEEAHGLRGEMEPGRRVVPGSNS